MLMLICLVLVLQSLTIYILLSTLKTVALPTMTRQPDEASEDEPIVIATTLTTPNNKKIDPISIDDEKAYRLERGEL